MMQIAPQAHQRNAIPIRWDLEKARSGIESSEFGLNSVTLDDLILNQTQSNKSTT